MIPLPIPQVFILRTGAHAHTPIHMRTSAHAHALPPVRLCACAQLKNKYKKKGAPVDRPDSWRLDDGEEHGQLPLSIEALKRKTKSHETRHTSVRLHETLLGAWGDLLATRYDPWVKTVSDVANCAMLEYYEKQMRVGVPDGAKGFRQAQVNLLRRENDRALRDDYLDRMKIDVDKLRQSGDLRGLSEAKSDLQIVFSDGYGVAPQTYLDDIQNLIDDCSRLLQESVEQ